MSQQRNENKFEIDDITQIYASLVSDVESRENDLADDIPIDSPQGIDRFLSTVEDSWVNGSRTLRSLPTLNVYGRYLKSPISDGVKKILVGLDAEVNAIDDLIDTRSLRREQKICFTTITAFSNIFIMEGLPNERTDEIINIKYDYFTELAQIPLIEQQLLARLRNADSREEQLSAIEEVYAYRARDIKAFAKIPARVQELDGETTSTFVSDLQTYRAHYLLYEDVRHIKRDLREGHESPVLCLLDLYDDPEQIISIMGEIYDSFEYNERSEYTDLLVELERRPDDLTKAIKGSMRVYNGDIIR